MVHSDHRHTLAAVHLLVLLSLSDVSADIVVKDLHINRTKEIYPDQQANFGPDFPIDGLKGVVMYAAPDPEACGSVTPPPANETKYAWILLIARGGECDYVEKVLAAQRVGYDAVIVHNYKDNNSLIVMPSDGNGSKVLIPSTFVGWKCGNDLHTLYNYTNKRYIITVVEDISIDFAKFLWPFLLVMAICILVALLFLLVKCLRDRAKQKSNLLSKKHLKKIPVKKFRKGDYYDTCSICLDEYEEGEKIRVLPCDHVYHMKCVDPWLTKNKKTCPVCKRRVIPEKGADSESGSETEDGQIATGYSETTPLLRGGQAHSHGSMAVTGMPAHSDHHSINHETHSLPANGMRLSNQEEEHRIVGEKSVLVKSQIPLCGSRMRDSDKNNAYSTRQQKQKDREQESEYQEENGASTSLLPKTRAGKKKKGKSIDKKTVRGFGAEGSTETDKEEPVHKDYDKGHTDWQDRVDSATGEMCTINGDGLDSFVNPSCSENREVVRPGEPSRHELNEVV